MMQRFPLLLVALALCGACADNSASTTLVYDDTCGLEPFGAGVFSALLEQWATAPALNERQGRIMTLPPTSGYYVTDRVDVPPPPPQHGPPIPPTPPAPMPPLSYGYQPPAPNMSHQQAPPVSYGQLTNGPLSSGLAISHGSNLNGPSISHGSNPYPALDMSHSNQQGPPVSHGQPTNGALSNGPISSGPSISHGSNLNGPSISHGSNLNAPSLTHNPQTNLPSNNTNIPFTSQIPSAHGPLLPHGPPYGAPQPGPVPYEEWSSPSPASGTEKGGKIVNRPTGNKDKFRPSPTYDPPASQNQIPHYPPPPYYTQGPSPQYHPHPPSDPHRGPGLAQNPNKGQGLKPSGQKPSKPGAVDRVDEPPQKSVSETDLYLLSAIEKLVQRVDLVEKRLRKLEESVHYFVAGHDKKPEPCAANFTRVGAHCYHFSPEATDWKTASLHCRKMRGHLLEIRSADQRKVLVAAMLGDKRIRGMDIWTGGLNPGLLWIWAGSARPVLDNTTASEQIAGEGRCLALVHDYALNNYVYRGQDCALRHRFVCEKEDDKAKLSNEISREVRRLRDITQGLKVHQLQDIAE